ncbi:MAG TPA: DUF971 domain-containing protein [Candidatus Acidoferrales bacterium]|nr:DUF971 domain-containing protein [Candidatus Acidoferrales bacterium]
MPLPIDPRKKPSDVKVYVTTGEGVAITWSDGHASRYDFPYLRDNCPCATCRDEREKKSDDKKGGADLLPMYKPKVKAQSAAAVGNYAIQIRFSDGHATGIYSFDCLREMCPCEACAREFRPTAAKTTA